MKETNLLYRIYDPENPPRTFVNPEDYRIVVYFKDGEDVTIPCLHKLYFKEVPEEPTPCSIKGCKNFLCAICCSDKFKILNLCYRHQIQFFKRVKGCARILSIGFIKQKQIDFQEISSWPEHCTVLLMEETDQGRTSPPDNWWKFKE